MNLQPMNVTILIFGTLLPWLLVGLGCWLGFQLVRQNGRILLRLEAMERRLAQVGAGLAQKTGLPVGSAAPDFELPDLADGRRTLAQFRGKPVLLMFFNPRCGFCTKMVPDLAALAPDGGDGRPVPLVITTGEADRNRKLVQEHGLRCPVLLQEKTEISSKYQANGTPSGYLIDEQGKIASELAVGADALLTLAVSPSTARKGNCGCAEKKGKTNKGLAASRLNRSGLKAGTPAPSFRLPRLDGGELALEEHRGRRVLLVFSDPQCQPCDQLAPQLEQLHRENQLQVLMVSRREPEANRAKVAQLGLTFPVALQKSWEVSLLYAIFATPVGYLIDEQGVIAADVATGVESILALAGTPAGNNGTGQSSADGQKVASLN
jgi:peroxiredoxin